MSRPPMYVVLPRAEVESSLGPALPPTPGAPMLRLPADSGLGDGGVAVYPHDDRPGFLWYVLDNLVYEQDAGDLDETLAALVPGSVLDVVPPAEPDTTPPDSPPWTESPPGTYSAPE